MSRDAFRNGDPAPQLEMPEPPDPKLAGVDAHADLIDAAFRHPTLLTAATEAGYTAALLQTVCMDSVIGPCLTLACAAALGQHGSRDPYSAEDARADMRAHLAPIAQRPADDHDRDVARALIKALGL